jgi:tetratricopeptide (TPR) repeat protein
MIIISRFLLIVSAIGMTVQASAQDITGEDCELGERYFLLAQDSLEEFNESEAAGWLVRASSVCSRFEYFQALGELWMQSLLPNERAGAVDAFVSAIDIAESDQQRAEALYQYATLLAREGDPQNALGLITTAAQLDTDNTEITELVDSIQDQVQNFQQGATRAGDEVLFRPLTGEGEQQSATLSAYPWPPEEASWQIRIDQDVTPPFSPGMKLSEVETRLSRALRAASYSASSLYGAPNGFVMVTRLEATDADGVPLEGADRFRLPDDKSDFALGAYIRSLFFAPEGLYRFIAFIVSDSFDRMSDSELTEDVALERLRRGALRLPPEIAELEFTENHRIDALIYEFRKGSGEEDIETILPGRISADEHLENSGLSVALFE